MITRHAIWANASTHPPNRPLPCLPRRIWEWSPFTCRTFPGQMPLHHSLLPIPRSRSSPQKRTFPIAVGPSRVWRGGARFRQHGFSGVRAGFLPFSCPQHGFSGARDYDFKPVFFIGILNYKMEGQSDGGGEYIHRYSIRNDENGQRLTDSLQFVFMELAGFDKRLQDCNSFEDKFLYFFKNLPKFVIMSYSLRQNTAI